MDLKKSETPTSDYAYSLNSVWHWVVSVSCLLSIPAHYVLRWAGLKLLGSVAVANIPFFIVMVIGGLPMIWTVLVKISKGNFGADILAVLAFGTSAWLGEYMAATLIVLMLVGGELLELYAMRKASDVLQALASRMPAVAHRKQAGGALEEIALAAIALGDELVVYPHETAPADGTVVEGNGAMDESYLTGEPYQVAKAPGATVLSGSINGEAALTVRTDKLPSDSRYAQIMMVMQDAEQKRPTMRRLGDQIGAWFTPVALLLALAAWYFTGDSLRFLAVLVVATPCPLLIAIPVTIISAISMAAKQDIIIKDPTVLERLPTCRTAIFDKTGTLTYGQPKLTEVLPAPGIDSANVLQRAASLEQYSKHPLAGAILQAAASQNLKLLAADAVAEKQGQGLTGTIAGTHVAVTHRKKLLTNNPAMAALMPPTTAGLECMILLDGQYAATFRFRDAPRAEGKSFIGHLSPTHHFNKVMLVSGDREEEVTYLAQLLGITDTIASASPEQKVAIIRRETALAPTLFMGDGINDAPALASATVGIAFGQHSSVTAEAAGAVILDSTLVKVDELLHISQAMRRIMLQSAIGGMALSLIAMGFAATGAISPVQGALLQEAIDVIAIANALRLSLGSKIETDF